MLRPISQAISGYYLRLTPRERVLLLTVGGTLLVLANVIALSVLLRSSRDFRKQLTEKSQTLRYQEAIAAEAPLWEKRAAWLHANQPVMNNRALAGSALLNQVRGAAEGHQVIITNPQIKPPPTGSAEKEGAADYDPVTVWVDTQSDRGALVGFMVALQQPANFIVFDMVDLRSDPSDPARTRGTFHISKWYAAAKK